MSMEDFFAFVTGCQALEELSLCKFRPADPAFPDVVRGRKDLEKIAPLTPVMPPAALRKLHLHDFAPFTARILQGMSLARSTDLSVTMDGHIRTLDQAYGCKTIPSLYTAFPPDSTHLGVLHGVTTVHVYFGTPTVYRIVARSGEEDHGSVTITADVPAPAACQSTPQHKARAKYRPNISKDLIELFGGAPVSDLTIVAPNAEHWKTLTGADWANTLRSLPFLKRLSVIFHPAGDCLLGVGEDDPLMTLITVLGTPPDDEDELCPHLECLTLHSSDVDPGVEIARTARTARIVDCLRIRKARGFPLAQLHILLDPDQGPSDDEWERYARVFAPHVDVVDFGDTAVEFETARSI